MLIKKHKRVRRVCDGNDRKNVRTTKKKEKKMWLIATLAFWLGVCVGVMIGKLSCGIRLNEEYESRYVELDKPKNSEVRKK